MNQEAMDASGGGHAPIFHVMLAKERGVWTGI
jgi:hypothetical protein